MGLGYQRIKNYDGSWIEWANNPTLPVVTADGTIDGDLKKRAPNAAELVRK